ncbi:MAG: flagellar biosynthesis anti-sigma factor FlgM [Deltaproteobacteria bacterium]|nr:flagellar biosynthesis anti-sigma factor FlgM [Deltaproteobacteria bacterium]
MSHRSKPRRGPNSPKPASSHTPHPSKANGGNGNGWHLGSAGAGEARPTNGSANGNGAFEKGLQKRAGETARSAPDVREDLVAHYRQIIAEGRYHPDPEEIAERMIRKGLLRDI